MSPRRDISFPRSEAEEFLAGQHQVILVAGTGDDAPLATPARARFQGGVLVVSVPSGDAILPALAADPRACCIAEQFPSYYEIKAVIVHGVAERTGSEHRTEVSFAIPLDRLTTFDFGRLLDAEAPPSG